MSDDLNVMLPTRVTMKVHILRDANTPEETEIDEEVVVRHLRMGDLNMVMKVISPLAHLFKNTTDIDPKEIFLEHTDTAMQLIAVCMRRELKWVEEMDIADAINLFAKLIEVNVDFFTKSVLPSALQAMGRLQDVVKNKQTKDGQTLSNS